MSSIEAAQKIRLKTLQPSPIAIERPIVVFDGGCDMCRNQMKRLEFLDRRERFAMLEYDIAIMHYPEVARGLLGDGLRVRFPDTSVTVGIDAIRSIGIRLPATAWIAWGLYVPGVRWFADRAYRYMAARRKTSSDDCEL